MKNVIVETANLDRHLFEDACFYADDNGYLHVIESGNGAVATWELAVFSEWTCAYRVKGAQDVADGGDK
jgi:hypothetical protein